MVIYNSQKFIVEQIDFILDNSFTDIELHICGEDKYRILLSSFFLHK